MRVITAITEMQHISDQIRGKGKVIGVVPTMGFLHEGHISLLQIMRKRCDSLVMTLFVNPAQFGPNEDFDKYPQDFDRDREIAEREGVDILFAPSKEEMYKSGDRTFVEVSGLSEIMCGKSRPGHFRGVTTIVTKLFAIVKPHTAIFGQKDAQQAVILRRMAEDLCFAIDIIVGPTVREPDGLAMSSRNVYLSKDERKQALSLSRALFTGEKLINDGETSAAKIAGKMKEFLTSYQKLLLEYVEIVNPETLKNVSVINERVLIAVAGRIGKARLIDNIIVDPKLEKRVDFV